MTTRRHISSGSPWEALAGYSRAVVQPMLGGTWVFVAGTLGMDDPASGRLADGAQAQTHRALDIVERALAEVPASLADTVRVVAYVPERADIAAVSAVLKQRLGAARPANTTVCCPLAVDGARVELEITALCVAVDPTVNRP
jgi:enamine deaminase RidA (YjgF/YER057c/UK114 family)